jgi:hypothetical protein
MVECVACGGWYCTGDMPFYGDLNDDLICEDCWDNADIPNSEDRDG